MLAHNGYTSSSQGFFLRCLTQHCYTVNLESRLYSLVIATACRLLQYAFFLHFNRLIERIDLNYVQIYHLEISLASS